jgi:hypothetical protein
VNVTEAPGATVGAFGDSVTLAGVALTSTDVLLVVLPPPPVTTTVTAYEPAAENVAWGLDALGMSSGENATLPGPEADQA